MKNVLKGALIVVAAVSLVIGMASCGGGGPTAPAKAFVEAMQKGDVKAMEKVSTPETMAMMAPLMEKAKDSMSAYGKITKTDETIDGDSATVKFTFENDETMDVTLKKVDGKWKVHFSK